MAKRRRGEQSFGGVTHPKTQELMIDAHVRFMALRQRRDEAFDLMWTGMLATTFTGFELDLLRRFGLLSAYDETLLANVKTVAPDAIKDAR
jgi:hypothetical protein